MIDSVKRKILRSKVDTQTPRKLLLFFQILSLILLLLSGYEGGSFNTNAALVVGVFIVINYLTNIYILKKVSGDSYIFLIVSMLMSIGIIIIYRIDPKLGLKQLIWTIIGVTIFFMTYYSLKNIKNLKNYLPYYIIMVYILFAMTFLLGSRIYGAKNWIRLGPISFQPAEISKLLIIFISASFYSNKKYSEVKFASYYLMGIMYSFILLLFLQKDLGMSLLFYAVYTGLQLIYEEKRLLIYGNLGLFTMGGISSYFIFDHVKVRFQSWINPWKYIEKQGYQITQSLFAVAEGGFFGKGLGLGHPEFIPAVHTDFIFSAICEEMGILTGIGIIMLFLLLVYRGFKISLQQKDKFYRILALGVSIILGTQSFIILGGVLKVIPLTGITLPFVSYGGSSMVSGFIALGILQLCSEEMEGDTDE